MYGSLECDAIMEDLLLVVTGDGTFEEQEKVKRHLSSCGDCRREYEQLLQTWHSLPYSAELTEPPKELRQQVMESIFGKSGPSARSFQRKRNRYFAVKPFLGITVVLTAGIWFGFWWRGEEQPSSIQPVAQSADTVYPVTHLTLKSTDPGMPASAEAIVMKQGGQFGIMIEARGLPPTQNQEAYQVWLIKDGQRKSAGTFCVDNQGNGVLHTETGEEPVFDAIGITLEPDARGSQPRGHKVLGTT